MKRVGIICTIGPSCDTSETLKRMAEAGMDIARLNFSHGTHAQHGRWISLIRQLNRKHGFSIKILQDLEGYRIRIGHWRGARPIALKRNQTLWLVKQKETRSKNHIPFDYNGPFSLIKKGFKVFIDDGYIELVVQESHTDSLKCRVIIPGVLKERKGVNIPRFNPPFQGLTPKDKEDLVFGLSQNVDFIAQSFVRSDSDILDLRKNIGKHHPAIGIIAKIENCEGIMNTPSILHVVDGIMVARGDMGVSLPIYQIPVIQKTIIKQCGRMKKDAITATQMLESMTDNPMPTRAEVTDVANAILDGTDYVMLSGETAAGLYPVEAVKMMRQIIDFTQKSVLPGGRGLKYDLAACAI